MVTDRPVVRGLWWGKFEEGMQRLGLHGVRLEPWSPCSELLPYITLLQPKASSRGLTGWEASVLPPWGGGDFGFVLDPSTKPLHTGSPSRET